MVSIPAFLEVLLASLAFLASCWAVADVLTVADIPRLLLVIHFGVVLRPVRAA